MTNKCRGGGGSNPGVGAVPVNVIMIVLQIGPTCISNLHLFCRKTNGPSLLRS